MKVYDMGRGQGKTTKCIVELSRNPNAILLVPSELMRVDLIKEHQGVKDIEERVFSAHNLDLIKSSSNSYTEIIIDELPYVLEILIRREVSSPIKFATMTTDRLSMIFTDESEYV